MKGVLDISNNLLLPIFDRKISLKHNFIVNMFFVVLLLELFLMGSGHALRIGSVTFRMIFFLISIFISFVILIKTLKLDKQVFTLLLLFSLTFFFSSFLGIMKKADFELIFEDVRPLAFFYMIIFFSFLIENKKHVQTTAKILKFSSIALAVGYILALVLLVIGILSFHQLFAFFAEEEEEVFFRGESAFFYKSFIFLCIGFIFFALQRGILSKMAMLLLFAAILLTFTRGFLVSLFVVGLLYVFIIKKRNLVERIVFFIILAIIIPVVVSWYSTILGEKLESDMTRTEIIEQVMERIDPVSIIIGHGFGIGVPVKPIHMEIAYAEILHKQGVIGIIFWLLLLYYTFRNFKKSVKNGNQEAALPFFLSSILIYVQSATNPFMNNPIGMSFLFLSLVSLKVLGENEICAPSSGKNSF